MLLAALLAGAPALRAQHHEAAPAPAASTKAPAAAAPAGETSPATQKRGSPDAPSHAPHPELRPLPAFEHVKNGNEAMAKARAANTAVPPPAERPAGAGRYVCAAIVCADADLDVPALLGLAQKDVLVIATPGPFVQPETVALLEQVVAEDRLSLILVLTHDRCRTLTAAPSGSATNTTLQRRLALAAATGRQRHRSLRDAMAPLQREQLLAASAPLREKLLRDELRVMPGEVADRTLAIRWLQNRAEELPVPPVK
ncbi:MAG: hypothetical protein JNN13_00940 [Planctomycetes bacterium]|nr:hypothetical protein [Planctomycetota bacterium]